MPRESLKESLFTIKVIKAKFKNESKIKRIMQSSETKI